MTFVEPLWEKELSIHGRLLVAQHFYYRLSCTSPEHSLRELFLIHTPTKMVYSGLLWPCDKLSMSERAMVWGMKKVLEAIWMYHVTFFNQAIIGNDASRFISICLNTMLISQLVLTQDGKTVLFLLTP